MRIYYPSVERGASEVRRTRHDKVADFLTNMGLEVQGRPSLGGSNRVSWLKQVDGMVVERANLTKQIERECDYAARIGKQMLIVMDLATKTQPGEQRRQPSAVLTARALSEARPNSEIRIQYSTRPGSLPELTLVRSALEVYAASSLGLRVTRPVMEDIAAGRGLESVPEADAARKAASEAAFAEQNPLHDLLF